MRLFVGDVLYVYFIHFYWHTHTDTRTHVVRAHISSAALSLSMHKYACPLLCCLPSLRCDPIKFNKKKNRKSKRIKHCDSGWIDYSDTWHAQTLAYTLDAIKWNDSLYYYLEERAPQTKNTNEKCTNKIVCVKKYKKSCKVKTGERGHKGKENAAEMWCIWSQRRVGNTIGMCFCWTFVPCHVLMCQRLLRRFRLLAWACWSLTSPKLKSKHWESVPKVFPFDEKFTQRQQIRFSLAVSLTHPFTH